MQLTASNVTLMRCYTSTIHIRTSKAGFRDTRHGYMEYEYTKAHGHQSTDRSPLKKHTSAWRSDPTASDARVGTQKNERKNKREKSIYAHPTSPNHLNLPHPSSHPTQHATSKTHSARSAPSSMNSPIPASSYPSDLTSPHSNVNAGGLAAGELAAS